MKQLIDELTIAGTHLDVNPRLQVDDRRTEQLAEREGAVRETSVAICGM